MDLPHGYREILMMKTHGTSYMAIDHVLVELFGDQDRIKPFIHDNRTTILYDAPLKIALCPTLVIHQGKFLSIFDFYLISTLFFLM